MTTTEILARADRVERLAEVQKPRWMPTRAGAETLALRAQVAAAGWRRLADERPAEGQHVVYGCDGWVGVGIAYEVGGTMRDPRTDTPISPDLWCPLPLLPEVI